MWRPGRSLSPWKCVRDRTPKPKPHCCSSQTLELIQCYVLSLLAQVIGRFAVAGSATLNAFLQTVRRSESLTPFDVLLLTHLMGKSTENEVRQCSARLWVPLVTLEWLLVTHSDTDTWQIAIKTSSFLAHRGRFHWPVMQQVVAMLVRQEWRPLLPSTVRFCSFLLAACFHDLTKPAVALRLVPIAVDCLGHLVESRTAVHEEVWWEEPTKCYLSTPLLVCC